MHKNMIAIPSSRRRLSWDFLKRRTHFSICGVIRTTPRTPPDASIDTRDADALFFLQTHRSSGLIIESKLQIGLVCKGLVRTLKKMRPAPAPNHYRTSRYAQAFFYSYPNIFIVDN